MERHERLSQGDVPFFTVQPPNWAKAMIVSNDTVEVSSPEVKEPKSVRYMWHEFLGVSEVGIASALHEGRTRCG